MTEHVYRICETGDWERARVEGVVSRSELDLRDGFMHLSSAGQVADTLARHFAGARGLALLTIVVEQLPAAALRWEPSARGELFPHLYAELPTAAVVLAEPLPLASNGRHRLPLLIERASPDLAATKDHDSSPVGLRVRWNAELGLAELDYPEPMRIGDEATMMAWEALIERQLAKLAEQQGGKIRVLVRLDNLWVAPKLMPRYLELVDKALVHWIAKLARWSSDQALATLLAHANDERALPTNVFHTRDHAIAFLQS